MTLERTHTRADVHAILLYLSLARAFPRRREREGEAKHSRINVRDQSGIVLSVYFASSLDIFQRWKGSFLLFYVPISGIDPRSLPRVVIDEVHLPVEVLGDVPPFRKRYLPIPSPWHISLRSKSIQNLFLSLSSCGRRAHICARGRTPLGPHIRRALARARARRPRRERSGRERDR